VERELVERGTAVRRPKVEPTAGPELGRAGALLGLQRTAGNAAVTSLVGGPTVQRQGLDDLFGPNPFGGGTTPAPTPAEGGGGAPPTPAPPTGEPATGEAPGGINDLGPFARTGTLIADNIIATSYTPGVGNVF
jgi:hypothetical protein